VVRLPVGVPVGPGGRDDDPRVVVQARHILLVEDDDNVRKALQRILQLDGHRLQVARDGPQGVELALATAPDVALIDIGLPVSTVTRLGGASGPPSGSGCFSWR
jgi:ActR/RegA family two-component response regulator